VPAKVDASTQVKGSFKWVEGVISGLPFTAEYNVTFEDESSHSFKIDGYLDQLSVSGVEKNEQAIKMKAGDKCVKVSSEHFEAERLQDSKSKSDVQCACDSFEWS
jgi:hypothetical protein